MQYLAPLFHFKHGDHICLFYGDDNQLMQTLTPYIAEGIRNGEKCFCAQKPATIRRLRDDLLFLGWNVDREIESGRLELHSVNDVYCRAGKFEPSVMMDLLSISIDQAIGRGFSGFRSAGELSWAADGKHDCDQLVDYEKMVEEVFPQKPATGMCQYDMRKFAPGVLEKVLLTHRIQVLDHDSEDFNSSLFIRYPDYEAEIVANRLVTNPKYYYVIQRNQRDRVLGWGIAPDFESARSQTELIARSQSVS